MGKTIAWSGKSKIRMQLQFNIIVRALRKQKSKAMGFYPDYRCAYRGANGNKCAIGHLIPDELYDSCYDEMLVEEDVIIALAKKGLFIRSDFFARMQRIHDNCAPDQWEAEWAVAAHKFDLTIPRPTKASPYLESA